MPCNFTPSFSDSASELAGSSGHRQDRIRAIHPHTVRELFPLCMAATCRAHTGTRRSHLSNVYPLRGGRPTHPSLSTYSEHLADHCSLQRQIVDSTSSTSTSTGVVVNCCVTSGPTVRGLNTVTSPTLKWSRRSSLRCALCSLALLWQGNGSTACTERVGFLLRVLSLYSFSLSYTELIIPTRSPFSVPHVARGREWRHFVAGA